MATEAPTAPPPAPVAPPPQAGDEQSKSIFKQARLDQGLDQPPAPPVETPPPAAEEPPSGDEPPAAPKKGAIPDDILDPSKAAEPKVHDAVAEILAAELPKGAKKEQIESFGKLKAKSAKEVQAALDRVGELEKQVQKATSQKDLDELRTKLTAAEERAKAIEEDFEKVAFEKSPKFQAQFQAREQTELDLAKSYLDGTEIKQEIIDLAAHATGRKRIEILKDAGVEDTVIQLIAPHLAAYDTVQREKQGALNNWKSLSNLEREEAQRQSEKAKAARVEQENKVFEKVLSTVDLLPLRKAKDNPEWNSRGEQFVERAKEIYNGEGADLPVFAETILKGVAYDAQQEVVEHLRGEVSSLRAENARLKSAAPGGSLSAGTQDGAPPDTSKMSRDEQARATFNAEKARAGAA